jgi:8-oxo-dGTP pyrophosphatase MutT (NUDIX family)
MHNNITDQFLLDLLKKCHEENKIACVDLLISNDNSEIIAQKRAANRKLFPGCWEVPGGHVEDGEGFIETIKREIKEELGLDFVKLIDFVDSFDWESDGKEYRNFQFLGIARGEPKLTEPEKTTELCWINFSNLDILLENRSEGDDNHYRVVGKALKMLQRYKNEI